MFEPRASQKEILSYTGGYMGISAVPGSGKTHTLSALAAGIITSGVLREDQEVLVVTLVNSAVTNFSRRVELFLKNAGTLPGFQYRVRTLHGLANDIVRERPALCGLSNEFTILDEQETSQIIRQSAVGWLQTHAVEMENYLSPTLTAGALNKARQQDLPNLAKDMATAFIRTVKDRRLTDVEVAEIGERARAAGMTALMVCAGIYADYERALHYRNALDFDDLIRYALTALLSDQSLLDRLRQRWPFILEDEAQDSSLLQQEILRLLAGEPGNWVRVGDPNQAIYATFTTANPAYLRNFIRMEGVTARDLPESGRSTASIIDLANHLVTWTREMHPNVNAREALEPPLIHPVPAGDANPNPDDKKTIIRLLDRKLSPDEELDKIIDSIAAWLPQNQQKTVAVLSSLNAHLEKLAEKLKARKLPVVELLRSTSSSRQAARRVSAWLNFLADPRNFTKMAAAFLAWRNVEDDSSQSAARAAVTLLRKLARVEEYLYPQGVDWLAQQALASQPEMELLLVNFRAEATTLLKLVDLAVDELTITLSTKLFTDPADLAVGFKLAGILRTAAQLYPEWRLSEFAIEAESFTKGGRKFSGFSEDDTGFDPAQHKGKVVLATIHKAKGLEWDRVYLSSMNNYDYPSGADSDEYIGEKYYLRNQLNLQAEVLHQLQLVLDGRADEYFEGAAGMADRQDYIRERLRVLYVGITRAKEELLMSWNSGKWGKASAAIALTELKDYLIQRGMIPGGS
jgi:DNA helicase-2/ATP-dependent DNA helicase PcrA